MKPIIIAPLFAAAVLLGNAFNSLAADDPAPAPKKQVQPWEHLALPQKADEGIPKIAAKINDLGRKGWELVAVADSSPGSVPGAKTYYFKRPL